VQKSDFIDALSHFRHLEVLDNSGLILEQNSPQEIELVLHKIVPRCNSLRLIPICCGARLGVACKIERHESGRIDWVISGLGKQGSFMME
jgi:hypothetical protein